MADEPPVDGRSAGGLTDPSGRTVTPDAWRVALVEALLPLCDPDEVKRTAVRVIASQLAVQRAIWTDIADGMCHRAYSHVDGLPPLETSWRGDDLWRRMVEAYRDGRPHVIGDTDSDPGATDAERAAWRAGRTRACVGVPIRRDGEWLASVEVHRSQPHTWSPTEIAWLLESAERTHEAARRARADQALRDSERWYRAVVDTQSEMVCRFRVDGEILFANAAYASSVGHTPASMQGRSFWDFIPAADHVHIRTLLDRLSPDRPEIRIENRFGAGDASRWTLWSNRALAFDRDGRVCEAQSTGIDITERRRAEQALLAIETRQRFLLTLSDTLRPLADPLDIQEAAARLTGQHLRLSRALYVETHDDEVVIHRCFADGVAPVLGRWAAGSYGHRMVTEMRSGRVVRSHDTGTDPQIDAQERSALRSLEVGAYLTVPLVKGGVLVATFSVHSKQARVWTDEEQSLVEDVAQRTWDAVERAKAQAAQRGSEARFRLMADGISTIIWVTDKAGRIEFVNREYCDFFGVTLEEVRSGGWQPLVHPLDVPGYVDAYLAAVRRGTEFRGRARVRRFDGEWRWIESNALVRRLEDGSFQGHVASSQDVTDLIRTQESLRDADARKDEFIAMLAHELRNPLAPLTTALHLLRRSGVLLGPHEGLLAMAERQTAQLTRLVSDLLDVSRITEGKIELRTEPVDLNAAIGQAASAFAEECRRRRHRIALELSEPPVWIGADPVRIAQILENLIGNACKYTPDGGVVAVAVRQAEGCVEMRVQDSGVGIDPAALEHLFEPFYQVDASLDRSQGGLGLGLALVRRLVELHGGTVGASSEGLGHGSTFVVTLPAGPESGAP